MKKNKINNDSSIVDIIRSPVKKEKKIVEISKEALDERLNLEGNLLRLTEKEVEDGLKLREKRYEEEFELRNGVKLSLKKIENILSAVRQPHAAKFPNAIPFFKEMYRLLGWTEKDPNKFGKPSIIGKYLKDLIYARFHSNVLPALQTLAMPGGIRRDKFYQYLNEEGVRRLEQYRDEAINLMKSCESWYEFRVKYGKLYKLPVQKALFEKYEVDKNKIFIREGLDKVCSIIKNETDLKDERIPKDA